MNERILLVDDEEIPPKVLTEMLKVFDYRVVAKQSADEALSAFREDPHGFDIIVSDQLLGDGILGTTLAKEFLKLRPDMPIVLCTGDVLLIRTEAMSIGIYSLIQKPVTLDRLIHVVESALRRQCGIIS